jgi:predicted nucleic acid-binding protein
VAAAATGYVELRAALAAAVRAGRVARAEAGAREARLESIWQSVSEVPIGAGLLRTAGMLAGRHALRPAGAIHLAALTALSPGGGMTLLSVDRDLRMAAASLGFALLPRDLSA